MKENETDGLVRDYLLSNSISWDVKFRPTAQPEVKEGYKFRLNWYIFLGGQCFEYSTGIASLPPSLRKLGNTEYQAEFDRLRKACETGTSGTAGGSWVHREEYHPKAADVLTCLLMDASANDYDFEEWAENYGYSPDSREAYSIYEACIQIHRKLKKIFTAQQREDLAKLLQDY